MKKSIIIGALVLAVAAVSCKKERDCVCKDSDGKETTTTIPKAKKADQETSCKVFAFDGNTCELK